MPEIVTLHPHAVHTAKRFEVDDTPVRTYDTARSDHVDADGEDVTPVHRVMRVVGEDVQIIDVPEARQPYWLIANPTRRYIGPTDCPDCGMGLSSRGTDFVCSRLGNDELVSGCHEGCLVACGIEVTEVPEPEPVA